MADQPTNITLSQASTGLNLNLNPRVSKQGSLTYALNAVVAGFDGQGISYQDELGNSLYCQLPNGYIPIGRLNIIESNTILMWMVNPETGDSEIGKIVDGAYSTLINSKCLGFSINHPIHKVFYRINVACGTEVYWTDGLNGRRFINLDDLPFKEIPDPNGCGVIKTTDIDCNKLSVQPNFAIPQIEPVATHSDGELVAGTYQFAVSYSSKLGDSYTSYYSITNPLPVFDPNKVTLEFDYKVNKSIILNISNIDTTGIYDYINLAVIKTVNNIASFELVGTYLIEDTTKNIIYTGQKTEALTELDIFEKFPVYTKADDIYSVQGVLGWQGMTSQERLSYQEIANKIRVQWQTYRLKKDAYKDPVKALKYRGYMRDEIIPLSLVPLLKNGHQCDEFPIPGRIATVYDQDIVSNDDITYENDTCEETTNGQPRWKVYNTAFVTQTIEEYDNCGEGVYQRGELAYWESTDEYDCDASRWGELAGKKIRHHKLPDCLVSPHFSDDGEWVYPLGFYIDTKEVEELIKNSSLTQEQKEQVAGFKIVRGNRAGGNKSVVAKGLITNVLKYSTKDNVIDIESVKPGGTVGESVAQKLISSAIDLINKSIDETGLINSGKIDKILKSARGHLQQAYEINDPSSATFKGFVQEALDEVKHAYDKIDSRDNKKSVAVASYLEATIEVLQSLLDSADSLSIINTETQSKEEWYLFPNYLFNDVSGSSDSDFFLDNVKVDDTAKQRYCLHSPDTSFEKPTPGDILKLELATYGLASSHIVQVKAHARYQFLNSIAFISALTSSVGIGFLSGEYGVTVKVFDGAAAFTAYNVIIDIIRKITPRVNPCYQVNAIGEYTSYKPVENNGNKQRVVSISRYLAPGMENVGDTYPINNFQRESSVYLKTNKQLPFPHEIPGVVTDSSKLVVDDGSIVPLPISSYYAALKRNIANQWGQIGSYELIDTGFQHIIGTPSTNTIFGGDTFINRFAYKSQFPFFLDNRVGAPDESDIFYNELSNVGRVKYWFSTDVNSSKGIFGALFGIRGTHFFSPKFKAFHTEGKIFLFAKAIPYFFCESEVNVDMRQAFNGQEGDFYPHVSTGIPDEWLQEINTTIKQDNTYHYNKTYSKQNKENYFSHLPKDYNISCETYKPYLTVYSDKDDWKIYRAVSQFEFPKDKGPVTSVDAITNNAILVRYHNTSQVYNAMLTVNTSNPQAAYLGNDSLFKSAPPLEFSRVEGGFNGSQHKMLIYTPYGPVFSDARRGDVFLLEGTNPKNIATPEVGNFLQQFLYVDEDNHFNGRGITGVWDTNNERLLLTKLDGKNSFTLSYNFLTQSWISFHSYLPNFYIPHQTSFYSSEGDGLWLHASDITTYHSFYGKPHDYVIEYPISYQYQDEILHSIKDYSQVLKYNADGSFVYTNDWFSSAIIWNDQQCSGILNLYPKPKHSLKQSMSLPRYNSDSKDIIYTKSNSFYQFNTLWALNDNTQPIWKPSQINLSIYRDLNQDAMDYSKRSHNKAPLSAKNLKIRLINSATDRRIISNFLISESQQSFK